jgi:hypothetical protein
MGPARARSFARWLLMGLLVVSLRAAPYAGTAVAHRAHHPAHSTLVARQGARVPWSAHTALAAPIGNVASYDAAHRCMWPAPLRRACSPPLGARERAPPGGAGEPVWGAASCREAS